MKQRKRSLSRRDFAKSAAVALGAAAALPFSSLACRRETGRGGASATDSPAAGTGVGASGGSARRRLTILQWSHFVPAYDRWFEGIFTKQWGERHGTDVVVEHMSANEINARGAAEGASGSGHDLFLFVSPPAAYADRAMDLSDVVRAVEAKHGPATELARRSNFDPVSKKWFAFSDSWAPDPGNYRIDLWTDAGFPNGPDTWEDLRTGGGRIRKKTGHPVGIGMSHEVDSNMALRALLWSFGGSEQDREGRVTIDSKETVAALKFARALFTEAMTPEVLTWDPSSNNRMILAGRASFVQNAISVTRTGEKDVPDMARRIGLSRALAGPARRLAAAHLMNCWVVWKFARNPEGAKQFLADLVDASKDVLRESQLYNLPSFPGAVPDASRMLAEDAAGLPHGKYAVLGPALDWTANLGYPGRTTAAVDEAFNTFVIPTMFARAATAEASPEEAAKDADRELRRIFERRRG